MLAAEHSQKHLGAAESTATSESVLRLRTNQRGDRIGMRTKCTDLFRSLVLYCYFSFFRPLWNRQSAYALYVAAVAHWNVANVVRPSIAVQPISESIGRWVSTKVVVATTQTQQKPSSTTACSKSSSSWRNQSHCQTPPAPANQPKKPNKDGCGTTRNSWRPKRLMKTLKMCPTMSSTSTRRISMRMSCLANSESASQLKKSRWAVKFPSVTYTLCLNWFYSFVVSGYSLRTWRHSAVDHRQAHTRERRRFAVQSLWIEAHIWISNYASAAEFFEQRASRLGHHRCLHVRKQL